MKAMDVKLKTFIYEKATHKGHSMNHSLPSNFMRGTSSLGLL